MSGELIGVLIAVLAVGVTFGRSDPDQQSRPAAGRTLDDAVRTHHRGLQGARESVERALTQMWQRQQRERERPRA